LTLFAAINLVGLAIRTPLFVFLEGRLVQLLNQFELLRAFQIRPIWVAHNLSLGIAILVVMFGIFTSIAILRIMMFLFEMYFGGCRRDGE
jgi:hypothetical protein